MSPESIGAAPEDELAHVERVVYLQSLELFRWCRVQQILRLAGIAREHRFEPGDRLFERDEPAKGIHCVVRGAVELQPGGARYGPLQTLGVLQVLTDRRYARTAVAADTTLTLYLRREDFFDLLAQNIEIVRALFRQLLVPDGDEEET